MNTVFIINPKSGQGKDADALIKEISSVSPDAQTYVTKGIGDAEIFVRNYCEKNGPARFIACGGDGTLNEVLNGAIDFSESEIGVMPSGTGNDFCRNFEGDFGSIAAQINGSTIKSDAIRYTTNGQSKYCANLFNIGFDCIVADMTSEIKKKPFIAGSMAYFISILIAIIEKKGANLKIEIDGQLVHDGPLLLTAISNGKCCGGGILCNPAAEINDGLIDMNIIYDIPRYRFITLLPRYMKGTHMQMPGIERFIFNTKCKKVKITPNVTPFKICPDGEIRDAGVTEFEIVHNAFNFVIAKD